MAEGTAEIAGWTTRRLMAWIAEALTRNGIGSPRLCAEMLLSHVLGLARLKLYTDPDRLAAPEELARLRELVGRALRHEPVQYLVGEAWFFGLPFEVDRRVLIPRPSTETIVEHVLTDLRARSELSRGGSGPSGDSAEAGTGAPGAGAVPAGAARGVDAGARPAAGRGRAPLGAGVRLADVCTGSGCVGIALLKHLRGAAAILSDISPDALEVAARNAARHGVSERARLVLGDLLAPLLGDPAARGLDYLVANPPYIPDGEWAAVPENVRGYEPHLALRGGPDGLDFVRPLLAAGPDLLGPGGLLVIEVATARATETAELARADARLDQVRVLKDADGLPRVVSARRV
ncbi:MAG TPA: HemK/PrmC family methyltransferase [Phycisphaerales bacterium]|nr:HemK/PrmC family methyltransferase [Phycisphaerales bacterium]